MTIESSNIILNEVFESVRCQLRPILDFYVALKRTVFDDLCTVYRASEACVQSIIEIGPKVKQNYN